MVLPGLLPVKALVLEGLAHIQAQLGQMLRMLVDVVIIGVIEVVAKLQGRIGLSIHCNSGNHPLQPAGVEQQQNQDHRNQNDQRHMGG